MQSYKNDTKLEKKVCYCIINFGKKVVYAFYLDLLCDKMKLELKYYALKVIFVIAIVIF
jgi:hypothetical protein